MSWWTPSRLPEGVRQMAASVLRLLCTVWWLVVCVDGLHGLLLGAAAEQPLVPEPSAAALERANTHAAANPQTLETWVWLAKATNAALGHRRWGHVLDAGTGPGSMSWWFVDRDLVLH